MITIKQLLEVVNINKDGGSMQVEVLDIANNKVGTIDLEGSGDEKMWTIIGADIEKEYRGKGYYRQALLQILDKYPTITIVSAFRSEEANRAWASLKKKAGDGYRVKIKVIDGEIIYYLTKN
jgi:predicted acetyltransferase